MKFILWWTKTIKNVKLDPQIIKQNEYKNHV